MTFKGRFYIINLAVCLLYTSVPFMAVTYIGVCLIIVFTHLPQVPAAFAEIVQSAFGLKAVAGGAIGAMTVAMQKGIARGIFSNEAGLGSAPIAAAAAQKMCIRDRPYIVGHMEAGEKGVTLC